MDTRFQDALIPIWNLFEKNFSGEIGAKQFKKVRFYINFSAVPNNFINILFIFFKCKKIFFLFIMHTNSYLLSINKYNSI